jgi:hypothetical protein
VLPLPRPTRSSPFAAGGWSVLGQGLADSRTRAQAHQSPSHPLVPASAAEPGSVVPAVVQAVAECAAERAAVAGLSADQRSHAAEAERLHLARCA